MTRSHPPTLLRVVRRTLVEECRVEPGEGILLGVSGGTDSTALLDVMGRLAQDLNLRLAAHGIDHGLRPEAPSELALAEALAKEHGVPFSHSAISVPRGGNLQARAREQRYAVLHERATALGLRWVATAHHANDRAETVLIRLLRGGIEGLGVLPARSENRLRPMIRAHRSDVLSHLSRHGLPFATDPSNADPHYLRTRVRHELLPLMEALSPGIVEHLCALSEREVEREASCGMEDENPTSVAGRAPLGRAQRAALSRAILLSQWGFELPVTGGGVLQLLPSPRPERRRGKVGEDKGH